jgi:hypothetical protein
MGSSDGGSGWKCGREIEARCRDTERSAVG